MSLDAVTALLTLTAMEIVLGIDNIVFISILVGRLKASERDRARRMGISLALIIRLGLLFSISWVMTLTDPLLEIFSHTISGRDLILLLGGLFLIAKSTFEIHHKFEEQTKPEDRPGMIGPEAAAFGATVGQILLLDIVFSLDSVITAVGMAQQVSIMVAAMLISMAVMLVSAKSIGDFVDRHPTIKILALSFLIMIGTMLLAEGLNFHIDKGYIYFAMFFSLAVEMVNLRLRKKRA